MNDISLPPILKLNYKLDKALLLQQANEAKINAKPYDNPSTTKPPRDEWKINRYTSEYIEQIANDLGIICKPRFFWLAPNTILGKHKDVSTLCSVNFILSDDIAPITIEGVDYTYSQALLNVQRFHNVINGPEERVLLKLSVFDHTFDELYNKFTNAGLSLI